MAIHLVTGGSGFVGGGIVSSLLERGHEVRIVDLIAPTSENPGVKYIHGSILNTDVLRRALQGVDVVHHVAAAVPLVRKDKQFQDINIEGTRLVCEMAEQLGVQHFNFMSSSAVYGSAQSSEMPFSEDTKCNPFENYGRSKLAAEQVVLNSSKSRASMTRTVIRPRTVLGAGRVGIFDLLFNWVENGKNIYILGEGLNKIQLVHVKDLAHFSCLCAENRITGIFNVGANRYGTLRSALENLCEAASSSSQIKPIPIGLAKPILQFAERLQLSPFSSWHYNMIHNDFYFKTEKAEKCLLWKPMYSNDEMLWESYLWYTKNRFYLSDASSVHKRSLKKGILRLFMK